jgi:hypothetical protein
MADAPLSLHCERASPVPADVINRFARLPRPSRLDGDTMADGATDGKGFGTN